MYKITYTDRFLKSFKRLTDIEQTAFEKKMKIFIEKKIKGKKDLYESSINMDIRIIWYYENDLIIVLIDIGHHDLLKKY